MVAASLAERWRDVGPELWAVAGGTLALWLLVLGWYTWRTEPRRVRPGAATQELAGPEPPAVVSLICDDWELGHEAVPATLLDLAARRLLMIDQVGPRTMVRVRTTPSAVALTPYEMMVLDHLRGLSARTGDGYVPAEALSTGPQDDATSWWRRFSREVIADARRRGLSRPRWTAGMRLVLVALAIPVALAVAAAASTLPDGEDRDPVAQAVAAGAISFVGLTAVAAALRGERDTPTGRETAARWLGVRELLADNHAFGEQPPAGVAIWDRHLAYGAALGVAHGAVQALPLGAESDREAWSHLGGRWRHVRIRYPDHLPPGYGRHPLLVAFVGAVIGGVGVVLLPVTAAGARALRDAFQDGTFGRGDTTAADRWIDLALGIVTALSLGLLLVGLSLFVAGFVDLCRGRRTVEGVALRVRRRGDDEPYWHVAVDDGSRDRIRAWRTARPPAAGMQGSRVRARVSPWLGHVADLTVVEPAPTVLGSKMAPLGADLLPRTAREGWCVSRGRWDRRGGRR